MNDDGLNQEVEGGVVHSHVQFAEAAANGSKTMVMVKFLLARGARVSANNDALHAAAFQEHGKVVRMLLEADADPFVRDTDGRTACDYASISEAIWPFFAARGCEKSLKPDLIDKGIIRKVENQAEESGYEPARVQMNPLGGFNKRADNTKVRGL
ncbi:hypothetical protein DYB37_003830 [Aphanomyces astaci]|uniref:Uncharacterized protein n=1 Tax=Aphanomyces astaci TaxID=112090 RepID=A0A3R7B7N3_APHAT|nr:hypothetical protein DYB35_011476 [Aphanomyces astaci]RHZ30676.1 hypothetical protein DYB37_003830 [Aphanomyces astaci]